MCIHPEKVYKPGRRYVSHFYSGGTTCDLTGRPRQVEVKLKCKESQSPSSVTLYLLEPETCEYTLGVETSIICPLLQHADTLGLFTQSQGKEEAEGTIDPAILVEEIMQSQHPEGEVEEVEEEVEELEVVEEQQVVIVEEKVVMLVEEEGVEEGETGDEEGDVKGERLSQKEKSKGETQPSGTPREEGQP
ncbi:putative endoplasmic reticulum lectin 1-like [Penaeus vannamei]|uniref:Endoplasmic reticulum lectin 1 n=1 Tax=Penaeus vannamei TaxID=6689 RepID=A0A423TY61_PENVA|nr:putative endoplasmic reticulum lectin 1-like [Penaeus vannamei]